VCWHIALLEDVNVTAMAQLDEACLAPAFSLTSFNSKKIFHWSDFIVTFRSHLNSFFDGTDQPKMVKKTKINISEGSVATVHR